MTWVEWGWAMLRRVEPDMITFRNLKPTKQKLIQMMRIYMFNNILNTFLHNREKGPQVHCTAEAKSICANLEQVRRPEVSFELDPRGAELRTGRK